MTVSRGAVVSTIHDVASSGDAPAASAAFPAAHFPIPSWRFQAHETFYCRHSELSKLAVATPEFYLTGEAVAT